MGKSKKRQNKQVIFLVLLSVVFLFIFYNFLCVYLSINLPNFLAKKCLVDIFKSKINYSYNISSFLAESSREKQRIEAHRLLQRSINELKDVQSKLKGLELERKKYVQSESKLKNMINDYIYLIKEGAKRQDRLAYEYNNEIESRLYETISSDERNFNKNYYKLKALLLERKNHLLKRINYLTDYIEKLNDGLRSAGRNVDVHKSFVKLPATLLYAENRAGYVNVNGSYKNNVADNNIMQDDGSFGDIKIKDLLNALHKYTNTSEKILKSLSKNRISREKVGLLFENGRKLEKRGKYEAALKNYRNILIFDLSPADREIVLSKIEEINRKIVIDRIIRKENKSASKLMAEADQHRKLGEIERAKDLYIEIIKEYPNSSYVDEAIESLLKCRESYSK